MDDFNPQLEFESIAKPTTLERRILSSLALALLSAILFTWIADSMSHDRTQNFDLAIRAAVHQYASPGLTKAMFAVSFMGGDGLVVAAFIALGFFLRFHRRRAALWLVVTFAGAIVLDLSLKYGFHRPRPAPFFGPMPWTYSFPSGHSLFSFCFYAVLAGLLVRRVRRPSVRIAIWSAAVLLVLAIGFSRVYLGVHYPSDVIAGYLAAAIWVGAMIFLDRARLQQKNNKSGPLRVAR